MLKDFASLSAKCSDAGVDGVVVFAVVVVERVLLSDNDGDDLADDLLNNVVPETAKMRRKRVANTSALAKARKDPLSLSRLFRYLELSADGSNLSASTRYLLDFWARGSLDVEEEGRAEEAAAREDQEYSD